MIKSDSTRALLWMILSALLFSFMMLFLRLGARYDAANGFGFWEALGLRALLMLFACIYVIQKHSLKLEMTALNLKWLALRGSTGTLSMICVFYGALHIPLAINSLFSNSNVFFIGILAALFLKERLGITKIVSAIGGFLGVTAILLHSMIADANLAGEFSDYLIASFAAPVAAFAYFSIRKIKAIPQAYVILSLAVFGVFSALVALLWRGMQFPQTPLSWIYLLLACFCGVTGQFAMTNGFQMAEVTLVSVAQYTGPVFSAILGNWILNEQLSRFQILGIVVAIFFGAMVPLWEAQRNKEIVDATNDCSH